MEYSVRLLRVIPHWHWKQRIALVFSCFHAAFAFEVCLISFYHAMCRVQVHFGTRGRRRRFGGKSSELAFCKKLLILYAICSSHCSHIAANTRYGQSKAIQYKDNSEDVHVPTAQNFLQRQSTPNATLKSRIIPLGLETAGRWSN